MNPIEISKLTSRQLEEYMKGVVITDKRDLEYEPVPKAKETMAKFIQAYKDKGMKVPGS